MKKIVFILSLLVASLANGQVETTINLPYTSSASPTSPSLLYTPDNYAVATSTYYPLIIFLHGNGEAGSNLANIYNNSSAGGPAYFIEHSGWPSSFTNPMDGQAYKFFVVSPQRPTSWSWQAPQLNYFINYMVLHYRIDPSRIYITGLSAGGEGVVGYMYHKDLETGTGFTPIYKPAASVPMAPAISAPTTTEANTAVADSIRMWGLGGISDIYGDQVQDLASKMNTTKPGIARITRYTGSHCCWGTYYNPTYHENIKKADSSSTVSMNIYEWMLQFARTDVGGTPTANAGTDQSINLPTSSVTLTGSGTAGSGHTISSYGWTKISGPAGSTITSPANSTTTVTGLTAGTFVFRITVTNNAAATATDDITVTVNAATTNLPPTVTVGTDQSVSTTYVNLTSTPNDDDGIIDSVRWTKVPEGTHSYKVIGVGSSTLYGTGTTDLDSAFFWRLSHYYADTLGIAATFTSLANGGTDPGAGLPTGTTPLTGFGSPDPIRNITQAIALGADIVIVNFPSNAYNNGSVSAANVATELQIIFDTAAAHGIPCYITTTQPRKDFNYSDELKLQVIRDTILNRFGKYAIDFYHGVNVPGTTDPVPEYAADDSIHLTNAGHRRLFEIVKAKNIFEDLTTTTSTIGTPQTANTTVTGLTTGDHRFQISVYDNNGLAASKITTVTATVSPNVANAGIDATITLPTDDVALDGSGSTGTITTYNWSQISGPNTAAIFSFSSESTTAYNLIEGTYVFRLTINSGEDYDEVTVTVTAAPPPPTCSGTKTVIYPDPDYGNSFYNVGGYSPGDTVLLNDNGTFFSNAIFIDMHGLPECPIVIMNDPALGRAVQFRGFDAQLACGNCTYVKITGSGLGVDSVKYGIDLEAIPGDWTTANWATSYNSFVVSGRSSNVEIERVNGRHGGEGFEIKQDGVCDDDYNFPNWIMDSIIIHDSRIRSTWLEGMYVGNTSPDNNMTDPRPVECPEGSGNIIYPRPIRLGYINIYNMDIDSTGRGGIQVAAGSGKRFDIHDNLIKHSGMNGDEAQGAGITMGTYTFSHVYNNNISNTYTWGITNVGGGVTDSAIVIENNTIDSSGFLYTYDNSDPEIINTTTLLWPVAIYTDTKAVDSLPAADSTRFVIINNKIGLFKNIDGYAFQVEDGYNRVQANGNIIACNTGLDGTTPVTSTANNAGADITTTGDCSGAPLIRGRKLPGFRYRRKT